ncbi:ubiquinone anaerobic biosynthesis protein UbiU [Rhodopseudomonas palustris]|uniref:Ubiquinone biosynthesis protein UbiU n=1 Tax=Rhodopseudomonas palustris (strain BisB18) TaxID=316056 RepID=Q20X35_RHOPB
MELICPAGTPSALRDAVAAGADAIYCGFSDETNARNFPGLNFSRAEMAESIAHAHDEGAMVLVAINTFARAGGFELWQRAVDDAVDAKADALIVADVGVMEYVARAHPQQRLHVSVQAAAANPDAIQFYVDRFNAKRVVLPRVLSVPEIAAIAKVVKCETEVFIFGGLCVMEEGRCSLSSYATGKSPNMDGVCSPASHIQYREENGMLVSRLGEFTINKFANGEAAAYPTLCKGRYQTSEGAGYLFEDPSSLDATTMLPELKKAGVSALKIEGRQRGRAYIERVVRTFRQALSALDQGLPIPSDALRGLSEGQSTTVGAYKKTWR